MKIVRKQLLGHGRIEEGIALGEGLVLVAPYQGEATLVDDDVTHLNDLAALQDRHITRGFELPAKRGRKGGLILANHIDVLGHRG